MNRANSFLAAAASQLAQTIPRVSRMINVSTSLTLMCIELYCVLSLHVSGSPEKKDWQDNSQLRPASDFGHQDVEPLSSGNQELF